MAKPPHPVPPKKAATEATPTFAPGQRVIIYPIGPGRKKAIFVGMSMVHDDVAIVEMNDGDVDKVGVKCIIPVPLTSREQAKEVMLALVRAHRDEGTDKERGASYQAVMDLMDDWDNTPDPEKRDA